MALSLTAMARQGGGGAEQLPKGKHSPRRHEEHEVKKYNGLLKKSFFLRVLRAFVVNLLYSVADTSPEPVPGFSRIEPPARA